MKPSFCILSDRHGVRLNSDVEGTVWRLQWRDLDEVVAYKVDCVSHDLICIGFRVQGETTYFFCDEETEGWDDLCRNLQEAFDIDSGWWERVAHPAFATNWTVLWQKKVEIP